MRPSGVIDAEVFCRLLNGGPTTGREGVRVGGVTLLAGVSGSGLVTSTAGNSVVLLCDAAEGFVVNEGDLQVVATKVDGVVDRAPFVLP